MHGAVLNGAPARKDFLSYVTITQHGAQSSWVCWRRACSDPKRALGAGYEQTPTDRDSWSRSWAPTSQPRKCELDLNRPGQAPMPYRFAPRETVAPTPVIQRPNGRECRTTMCKATSLTNASHCYDRCAAASGDANSQSSPIVALDGGARVRL